MKQKKLIHFGLGLALCLSFASCGDNNTTGGVPIDVSSGTEEESKSELGNEFTLEEGILTVAINGTQGPYAMSAKGDGVNGTGFEGSDIQLAAAVAEEMGLELAILDMDLPSALDAPDDGKADVVISAVSGTLNKSLAFSESYSTGVQVVIVTDKSEIQSFDELEGLVIATQEGTLGDHYASMDLEEGGFGEENLRTHDSATLAVESLLAGKADAVVMDKEMAKEFVKSTVGLQLIETDFPEDDSAIGMSKENAELLDAINEALATLEKDGTLDEIMGAYS